MIIRKLYEDDLSIRVKWMNDPRIYSSMHYQIPITLENTLEWYKGNIDRNDRTDLVLCTSENPSQILAFAGIVSIDNEVKKAETYLFVNPELLGKCIGTMAKSKLIEYAFNTLNLHKLYVITNEDNYASIRIQEKFGYKLEGRLRQEYKSNEGILKDRLYYGLLKSDWQNATY